MLFLSNADLVLPGRLLSPGTVVIDGGRILDVREGSASGGAGDVRIDCTGRYVVPGFIDVHVHGVEGADSLDGGDVVARIARRLPRYGVTAFCPTTVACAPDALSTMLQGVRAARTSPAPGSARVLPAHLESNFINPDYRGAQPLACIRTPHGSAPDGEFTGRDIVRVIEAARPDVGIVTLAPEIEGGIDLIRDLVAHGHRVSLGHSGASYEAAVAGIAAGARHATHLFNRMSAMAHRAPGLTGAVLAHDEIAAEIVCDGLHVHPSVVRVALSAKSPSRIMAITDGTAGAGLPRGSRTSLGGRAITVDDVAYLDDGTLAGSVLTMDRAFAVLVSAVGLSLADAAMVCSTTPARELGLQGFGVIAAGSTADLVVLDGELRVEQTYVGGELAWSGA